MSDTVIEPRLVVETGVDARVAQIIEPVILELGYQLVRVKMTNQNGLTMQIMAERPDGTMTVNDCEVISMAISPVLDVEDPIDKQYNLEISSPGIDRPMVRKGDFVRWQGHIIKCETSVMVEGRKRFKGKILEVTDAGFVLEREQMAEGEEPQVAIPFASLAEGRLILTDELIRDALKADKAARAAANQNDADDEDMEDEG
ncbi:ribosome maturation factor RimP [Rhizobium sp. SG_E_25_P2]|jgi:ribosome maturation factor RimP|uniref:ribosome maturation factor RimP n=1 Tax=Rhizobium sp. SG_E_25_P2 TaxID=2879942 RepID=UPI0024759E6C|nr:ribosome maturation factor RimP [Rhizobium sp. SG_E_25_P2]MDH6264777.1 ribosome maturation factor RimP [Rhizobium sp. SG_E_25_P2]